MDNSEIQKGLKTNIFLRFFAKIPLVVKPNLNQHNILWYIFVSLSLNIAKFCCSNIDEFDF